MSRQDLPGDREFGRLEARVDRLESLRQRAVDFLPSSAVILLLAGQWLFLWSTFAGIDERLDRLEVRMVAIETSLARIGAKLGTQP